MIRDGIQRNVFEYRDYRRFLAAFYEDQKGRKTGFTYANFAKRAGLNSPNYYKLVMDGEKNLTADNILKFAQGLDLDPQQTEFFETLVNSNQAKSALEKRFYQERLFKLKMFRETDEQAMDEVACERIAHWLPHTLFVLSKTSAWREDATYLRALLMGRASEDEITRAVQALKDVGLVSDTSSIPAQTTASQSETSIRNFYQSLVLRAACSLEDRTLNENVLSSYTVGVSQDRIEELKTRVRTFMRELSNWALESNDTGQFTALLLWVSL